MARVPDRYSGFFLRLVLLSSQKLQKVEKRRVNQVAVLMVAGNT